MNQNQPSITAFVVHWNQPDQCLDTVRRLCSENLQIVIIDNASEPAAFDRLRTSVDPAVETIRLDENHGWGPALNIELRKWLSSARSDYCLISAHDADPGPNCVH